MKRFDSHVRKYYLRESRLSYLRFLCQLNGAPLIFIER
jgi:hypothetical protein